MIDFSTIYLYYMYHIDICNADIFFLGGPMIKYMILGFLMSKDLTGYDIKQIMTHSTSNFMNASFGSIYPTLEKLEKIKCIESTKTIENGKYKKVYTITIEGRKTFLEWLETPINFMKSYEDILIKVFFFEHLSKSKALKLIDLLILEVNQKIKNLESLKNKVDTTIDFYQLSTLTFGIDHLLFVLKWCKQLKDAIKFNEGEIES